MVQNIERTAVPAKNKLIISKSALLAPIAFVVLSIFLIVFRSSITLTPWNTNGSIDLPTYASGNGERTAIIENSERSIVILEGATKDGANRLVYNLRSKPNTKKKFTAAKFVALDEANNLYILATNFGGAFDQNVERVLKFSDKGKFIAEIYRYQYMNTDFITTKGKISGMTYFDGALYLIRLQDSGFYLERVPTGAEQTDIESVSIVETVRFFRYPNALRNLVYFHLNVKNERLVLTTKSGIIKQYSFSGDLLGEWRAKDEGLAWTAASDDNNNLICTDILTNEVFLIETETGRQTVLITAPSDKSAYYRVNFDGSVLLAASYDNILVSNPPKDLEVITGFAYSSNAILFTNYTFSPAMVFFRALLFVVCLLNAFALFKSIKLLIKVFPFIKISSLLKRILLVGTCISFGTGLASYLVIRGMGTHYNNNIYNDLENVSRLMATAIDTDVLKSLTSPAQYESEGYSKLQDLLKELFTQLKYKGNRVYQTIWTVRDGVVYSLYDLEHSSGAFFPIDEYTDDSYYKEVYDTGEYVHFSNITTEGRWLFSCGPIFDADRNIVALIETGYDMRTIQTQMQKIVIQTGLIVASAVIAILLVMIECILFLEAYTKNRTERLENAPIIFYPEFIRAIVFVLFVANNLATALLPMYAAKLYHPLFNIPKEFIITLPFTTDVVFAALALLIIPNIIEKAGIKKVAISAAVLMIFGNILCLVAQNTLYLAVAYAFSGFSGGTLLLVINTIIGAQKKVEDVNRGFAHYSAAYLAGINVGVVLGSTLAQFFHYRIVYVFSTLGSIFLIVIIAFSVHSRFVHHIYDVTYTHKDADAGAADGKKFALLRFVCKPVVFGTLLLLLLPYAASMSFVNYFMPLYGTENGLRESNIGQLLLMSGLLAILFGTSLCEYVVKKFSLQTIVISALLLNIIAIYWFASNVSLGMLVITIGILAIVNVFALTNIQTFYATLYNNVRVSPMKALSVYSAVENLSMAIGPVVFSYILANDIGKSLRQFGDAMLLCLIAFAVLAVIFRDRKKVYYLRDE